MAVNLLDSAALPFAYGLALGVVVAWLERWAERLVPAPQA